MSLFSRNKEPAPPARADEVQFESLRRMPRGARQGRSAVDADADAAAPLDPAQDAKARARRRLIGATALALAAVVFVPMLFDRAPVAPADDLSVQIPDRDTPFDGRRGTLESTKGPLRPSGALPSVPATSAGADVASPPVAPVDATKAPSPEAANAKPAEKSADKSIDKPAPKSVENMAMNMAVKPADKPNEKSDASSAAPPADDPRALAALEGKTAISASGESASGKGFVVQVAAFSVADKARALRDQLSANGLKAYTEPLSTSQGLRTRVRLGPFASREAAERARQKLKSMKLDGSVVTL